MIIVTCVCALAAILTAAAASASRTRTELGGVDFDGYCRAHGYDGAKLDGPVDGPYAAYNWRCVIGDQEDSLSVIDVCREEYGEPRATARARNVDDAYSWTCYVTTRSKTAHVPKLL